MTRKIAMIRSGESSWNLECRPAGWIAELSKTEKAG